MSQAQVPGRTYTFPIIILKEAKRAATFFQTVLLKRAELKAVRNCKGYCADQPGMYVEPEPIADQPMHHRVCQERRKREGGPDKCIPRQKSCLCGPRMPLSSAGKHHHVNKGHARWQHHRDGHHLPRGKKHDQGYKPREMALSEQVVMINQECLLRESCQQRYRPGCNYQESWPDDRFPAVRRRSIIFLVRQFYCAHQTVLSFSFRSESFYRIVELLRDAGLVREIHLPGEALQYKVIEDLTVKGKRDV